MKRIKLWIKAFIIRTVVDDYQMNGKIRTMVKSEDGDTKRCATLADPNRVGPFYHF
jgi:hypothetical protein